MQGIVSCNQLVRQLVPLLVDATLVSLDRSVDNMARQHAAVQRLARERLTLNVAAAMHWPPAAGEAAATAAPAPNAFCTASAAAVWDPKRLTFASVTSAMLLQAVPPGHTLQLTWDAAQLRAAGRHGLLLLATAAPPCSHWEVDVTLADGSTRQLSGMAAPLPPLTPSLQERWVPRHWADVMQGMDWQHNATRLLYIAFTGGAAAAEHCQAQRLSRVNLTIRGSTSGGTALMAQLLDDHPLSRTGHALQLQPPPQAARLQKGHAIAVLLRLPQHVWPRCDAACGQSTIQLACLAVLLLGSKPPWTLVIEPHQCEAGAVSILPALVGVAQAADTSDSIRVAAPINTRAAAGSSVAAEVPLWEAMASLHAHLLISDPQCAYTLRWACQPLVCEPVSRSLPAAVPAELAARDTALADSGGTCNVGLA